MTCTLVTTNAGLLNPEVRCGEPTTVVGQDGAERCYDHAKMCPCGNPSTDGTCAGHPADWKPVEV